MIQPPLGKPWLLYALLGSSLALNLLMVSDRDAPPEGDPVVEVTDAPAADVIDDSTTAVADAPVLAEASALADATLTAPAEPEVDLGTWQSLEARVEHSLARTFQKNAGEHADALSAVYARLFMWDIDLRRDLQKGDKVRVLWRLDDAGNVEISAAKLRSRKFGKTFTAYRWQAPGDEYISYWRSDGVEASLRLKNSPLASYEQITSLLKDRPTHRGMDFKTPVGTAVVTPKSGNVTRVNWNWAANGNCVEVQFDDGTLAKFLHLEELKATAGARVQPGQVIALTGNTGRSTAPHLHYQLDQGKKNLDPIDYHGTERRRLTDEVTATFKAEVERLNALMKSDS
jgi:murein DD-endopeptidase MepM/ murein hydrolase activator NlpD